MSDPGLNPPEVQVQTPVSMELFLVLVLCNKEGHNLVTGTVVAHDAEL